MSAAPKEELVERRISEQPFYSTERRRTLDYLLQDPQGHNLMIVPGERFEEVKKQYPPEQGYRYKRQ